MGPERVALGRIGRAHGVHGAFRVWPYADDLERFRRLRHIVLERGTKELATTVSSVLLAPGHAIIQTAAITNPEDVKAWQGGDLEIDASERVALPAGKYFHDQIVGLQVETASGEIVGTIVAVMEMPAHDVYVCRRDDQEYLIPAIDLFVTSIDLATRRMVINPIPGMVD